MKKQPIPAALTIIVSAVIAAHSPELYAQIIDPSVGAGAAAAAKVSTIMSFFLGLVKIAGYSLFVIAIMFAAYKIAFVEGYKASDAKGIVIGGIVFGLAATLASYLTA